MKLLPLLLLAACTTQPTWHEALSRVEEPADPYTAACVAYCNARMVLVRPSDTEDLLAFWQTVLSQRAKERR